MIARTFCRICTYQQKSTPVIMVSAAQLIGAHRDQHAYALSPSSYNALANHRVSLCEPSCAYQLCCWHHNGWSACTQNYSRNTFRSIMKPFCHWTVVVCHWTVLPIARLVAYFIYICDRFGKGHINISPDDWKWFAFQTCQSGDLYINQLRAHNPCVFVGPEL